MKALKGYGLALSGGGYRASLFHLGATRRLHELGILQEITRLSSVSGGSIYAAYLAQQIIEKELRRLKFQDWDAEVSRPFKKFVRRDIRTGLFLRHLLWNWKTPGPRAKGLVKAFSKRLNDKKIVDLPPTGDLEFIFLATNMEKGVSWRFTRDKIGDHKSGFTNTPESMTIAKATAASACFPPLFGPIPIERSIKDGDARTDYLTDGGVYDNTGMEPIWRHNKVVLVSDCGAPFEHRVGKSYISRVMRYANIGLNQVGAQRRRALMRRLDSDYRTLRNFPTSAEAAQDSPNPCPQGNQPGCFMDASRVVDKPEGTYWRLQGKKSSYEKDADAAFLSEIENFHANLGWFGYSDEVVDDCISKIRTDLDSFTTAESAILENHGYFLADLAIRRHAPSIKKIDAAFAVPNPPYLNEALVRKELKNSGKRLAFWMRWFNKGHIF